MTALSAGGREELRARDALGPQLLFCLPSTPLGQLAKLMAENRAREVPVIVDQRVLGYVSYADVIQRFVEGRLDGSAAGMIRNPVLTVRADAPLQEAIALLQQSGRESAVVTADGTLPVGALTAASVLEALMPEKGRAERQ